MLQNIYLMKYEKTFDVCKTCPPAPSSINRDLYFRARNKVKRMHKNGTIIKYINDWY
jgi:predicted aldo/keto reductase-like oxidoreductase